MDFVNYAIRLILVTQGTTDQCNLALSDQPNWMPLIWDTNRNLVYPLQNSEGIWGIQIAKNASAFIGCAPTTNHLQNFKSEPEIQILCSKDNIILGPNGASAFRDLGCTSAPKEQLVIKSDSAICSEGLNHIQILHETSKFMFPLINICFDPTIDATVVASHIIYGSSLNPFEVSNNRPGFKSAQFYPQFSVATAYTQSEQLKTMTTLVGSSSLAAEYIDVTKSLYLVRGHLAPDGDFVHVYEQNATYYYINVVPQWQSINNGHWKALETAVRNYAVRKGVDLKVWTGSHDILELNDINQNLVQIFLGKTAAGNKFLPVPKFTIKIIYDVARNAGVAVLLLNNPHATKVGAGDVICADICNQITWVTWNRTDFRKGYTYCCEVNEVRQVWPHFLDFGNLSLLT